MSAPSGFNPARPLGDPPRSATIIDLSATPPVTPAAPGGSFGSAPTQAGGNTSTRPVAAAGQQQPTARTFDTRRPVGSPGPGAPYVRPPVRIAAAPQPQAQHGPQNPQQPARCPICGFVPLHQLEECPWRAPDLATSIFRHVRLQLGRNFSLNNPLVLRLMHIYAGTRNGTASALLDRSGHAVSLKRYLPDGSSLDWTMCQPAWATDMVPLPRIRDFEAMLEYSIQRHQQVQAQLARTQQAQTPQTIRSQAQAQQHGIPYVNRPASNLNVTNNGQPAPSNDAQQQRTAVDNQPAASLANSTASTSASVAGMFEPLARTNRPPAVEPWIPVNSQPREQARPNPIPGAPRAVANPVTASRASIKQESGPEQSKASANKPGQPTAVTAAAPSFPRPGQGFRIEKNQTRRVTQFGIRFGQASLSLQQLNTQPRPQHQHQQHQQHQQHPHDRRLPFPPAPDCPCADCKTVRAVRVQVAQPSTGAPATAGPATATARAPAPATELASRPQVPAAPIVHRLPPRPPTLKFPLSGKALTTHFLAIRKDPYAVLGIHRNATAEQIKQAYRKACKQHHPDKNAEDREGALERFHVVTQAYGVLKEEENREEYDRKVRMGKGVGGA